MINTFNNYSLAIEGSTKKVSIAILNKKKIIKVKYYQSKSNYEDHDTFFVTFTEFLNDSKINVREISSYYVGCGPGSFTGIRKVVAFVKALIISNFRKNIVSLSVNSLAIMAYQYYYQNPNAKSNVVLSALDTQSGDYYVQLFLCNKHFDFLLNPISNIEIINLKKLKHFLDKFNINQKKLQILGLIGKEVDSDQFNFAENISLYPTASYLGKLAFHLQTFEKNKSKLQLNHKFFYNKVFPLYVRSPKTN